MMPLCWSSIAPAKRCFITQGSGGGVTAINRDGRLIPRVAFGPGVQVQGEATVWNLAGLAGKRTALQRYGWPARRRGFCHQWGVLSVGFGGFGPPGGVFLQFDQLLGGQFTHFDDVVNHGVASALPEGGFVSFVSDSLK